MEKVSQKSKVKSQKFQNVPWSELLIVTILLLAAYLRLHNISGYMTFLGDEGRDVMVVRQMIVDHKWTLLGPTASVGGFFLGPIYYYFMLPFLWAWRLDPTGPAVMVGLFGVATVYLVYRAGRDLFDPWVGIVAAALYATSPVVIAYSRSSWNPNIVPFFSLLTIYLLWRYAAGGGFRNIFGAGIAMGIGLQLHYLFLFLFPVAALWIIVQRKVQEKMNAGIWWIMGFLFGYAPFLLFEIRHGFPNTRSIMQFILTGKDTGLVSEKYWNIVQDVLFRLVGRLVLRLPQPEIYSNLPVWQKGIWHWAIIGIITIGITMLGIGICSRKYASRWRLASSLILLWGIVIAVLFGFYKREIYDYYFGIWFALPFLVTGMILYRLKQRSIIGTAISAGVMIFLVWWNWQGQPFQYAPNNQLAQARAIAQAAIDKTDQKPFNFALITHGNSDHVYRYFFDIWSRAPVTIEPEFKDPERATVTDQLIVICEIPDCKPLGHPLWEIAGFGSATISGTWQTSFVTIHKLIHL